MNRVSFSKTIFWGDAEYQALEKATLPRLNILNNNESNQGETVLGGIIVGVGRVLCLEPLYPVYIIYSDTGEMYLCDSNMKFSNTWNDNESRLYFMCSSREGSRLNRAPTDACEHAIQNTLQYCSALFGMFQLETIII